MITRASDDRTSADLQRAVSTLYYSLFHELALTCANSIAGDRSGTHSKHAWKQVYRALEHKKSKNYCAQKGLVDKFPKQIRDFANHYVKMQEQRHLCDYDPYYIVSEIELDLYLRVTKEVIEEFRKADDPDKRAFCALVLFQQR